MFTLTTLFSAFSGRKQKRTTKPEKFFIAESTKFLRQSKTAPKTKQNSWTALRSIRLFYESDDIPLSKINASLLCRYEQWLWARGVSRNTSAEYMRSLRALYNKVSGKRHNNHPFAAVVTAIQHTCKRAVNMKVMHAISEFESANDKIQLSRDVFMFSFYCMGMPFVDIAHLRREQIDGDTLIYQRQKTGVEVVLHLEPEALRIINRYKNSNSRYVFPLLKVGKDSHSAYRCELGKHNKRLHIIERAINITERLTTYVARHTWATLAFGESGDISLVASAIGHNSTKATPTYIRPLSNGKTATLNKRILNKIKNAPIRNRYVKQINFLQN